MSWYACATSIQMRGKPFDLSKHNVCMYILQIRNILWQSFYADFMFIQIFDEVISENSHSKQRPLKCVVDNIHESGKYCMVNVKTTMPSRKAREYAHPNERDLVIFEEDYKKNSKVLFSLVDNHRHNYIRQPDGTEVCEVTIHLKLHIATLPVFCRKGCKVVLSVVLSLANEIRQWEGLVNLHTSQLARDILHPRGKDYFCCSTAPLHNVKVCTYCARTNLVLFV